VKKFLEKFTAVCRPGGIPSVFRDAKKIFLFTLNAVKESLRVSYIAFCKLQKTVKNSLGTVLKYFTRKNEFDFPVTVIGNEVANKSEALLVVYKKNIEAFFNKQQDTIRKPQENNEQRTTNPFRKFSLLLGIFSVIALCGVSYSWFNLRAEYAKFYPASCTGGWRNLNNAEGKPDLSRGASPWEFTDSNSAVLSGAASQIFCGSFQGDIPEDAEMKTLRLKLSWSSGVGPDLSKTWETETNGSISDNASSTIMITAEDSAASSTQQILDAPDGASAEIQLESGTSSLLREDPLLEEHATSTASPIQDGSESADENIPNDENNSVQNSIKTDASDVIVPTEELPLETSNTPEVIPESAAPVSLFKQFFKNVFAETVPQASSSPSEDLALPKTIAGSSTEDTLPITETPAIDLDSSIGFSNLLEVVYTFDGENWVSLGTVTKTDWKGEFDIPISDWDDISRLQVSIQSLPSAEELPTVYLDGMWIEAGYRDLSKGIDPELYAYPGEADGLPEEAVEGGNILRSSKKSFRADEDAVFELHMFADALKISVAEGPTVEATTTATTTLSAENASSTDATSSSTTEILPADPKESKPDTVSGTSSLPIDVLSTDPNKNEAKPVENTAGAEVSPSPDIPPKTTASNDKKRNSFLSEKWGARAPFARVAGTIKNFFSARAQAPDEAKVVRVFVTDIMEQELPGVAFAEVVNGQPMIRVTKPETAFRPGAYELHVDILKGDTVLSASQTFTWGVLAVNTDKTVYYTGESAYLQMAALTSTGNTFCNADLILEIESPTGNISTFATGDGTMSAVSPCIPNNVTDNPDFFAHYSVFDIGTYHMTLVNILNGYQITDTFEARENIPFEVSRIGATRINPFKSQYTMRIGVKAKQDFSGDIIESVPKDFVVSEADSTIGSHVPFHIEEVTGEKYLVWSVDMKTDDAFTLAYTYDAPKISPQFYLLGPLRFEDSKNWIKNITDGLFGDAAVFKEARRWQLASDADKVVFLTAASVSPWAVPYDWSDTNTIAVIGPGGDGDTGGTAGNGGGSGGAYSYITNLAGLKPGMSTANFNVGAAGASDTWFSSSTAASGTVCDAATQDVCADAGTTATAAAGAASSTVANNVPLNRGYAGGAGGTGSTNGDTGGGGGGAGGPSGIGKGGGGGVAAASPAAGGGGGGADNGGYGVKGGGQNGAGGNGGDNNAAGGHGNGATNSPNAVSTVGTLGGGGGGGAGTTTVAYRPGAQGGNGQVLWTETSGGATAGPGGGGGGAGSVSSGSGSANGANGGNYGAGGGGGELAAGLGAPGIIVITYTPNYPILTQRDYIFLNDATTTVNALLYPAHSAATSSSISEVKKGERLIVKIQIDNTGTATSTSQYRLQYDKNNGVWTDLSTTTEIRTSLSSLGALWGGPSGVPLTSRQVTAGCNGSAPTFTAGRFVAGTATSTSFSIGPAKCTELAYSFETSGATLGQVYRLRVVNATTTTSTTALNSYPAYPTFTIESTQTAAYSKEARGGFSTSTIDIANNIMFEFPVAIGVDGYPVISFHDNTVGTLNFIKCNDSSCSSRTSSVLDNTAVVGHRGGIAIGSDGFPVMSYLDDTNSDLKFYKCDNISCTSGTPSVLDSDVGTTYDARVAIGSDGYPMIAYWDAVVSESLRFIKCNDLACTSKSENPVAVLNAYGISLSVGADGLPVISYYVGGTIHVAKCGNIYCSSSIVDTAVVSSNADTFTSIAIGSDGYPIIAFATDAADSRSLKLVKCNNADCSSSSVSFLGQSGSGAGFTHIAIGIDGFPAVTSSGYDVVGGLRFFKCNDISCSAYTNSVIAIQPDDDGVESFLAIGADGNPVVVYNATSTGYLKIANCSNPSCAPAASSTANLASNASSYSNFFDDVGYNNVATDDTVYDTITGATSTKLAFNFKKAASVNTADILVTWNGQISIATSTSLQAYNNTTSAWDTIQTNASPTPNSDFTLTGTVSGSKYYDGSNIATMRLVTGTTTKYTTLKTDQIAIQFVLSTLTQRDYIFLNDATSTVNAYLMPAHSAATSTSISNVKIGERMIVKIQVDNTGLSTSTNQYRLQWSSSTAQASGYGNWNDLDTTTELRWSLSQLGALSGRPGGVPLTSRQVSATTTCSDSNFTAGRFVAGTATSTAFSIGPSKCTELAYAFETSGALTGKYYRLRLVSASTTTAFDNYIYYPTFQIESTQTLTYSKEARGSSASIIVDSIISAYTSAAIGIDGFPVIAYRDAQPYLKVAKCQDAACSSATVTQLNSVTTTYSSLAIGADGFPVMAYRNSAEGLNVAKCINVACTGSPTITALNALTATAYTSIAIGADGFPIMSYQGTSGRLDVAKCVDDSCANTPIITTLNAVTSTSTSIAIGTDGFPVISYLGTSNRLYVAKCIDAACTGTPIITQQNNVACDYTAMAIGADGFPVIAYRGTSGYLNIAKCTNTACTGSPTITVQNNINSLYISIAVGIDGIPVVSHYGTAGFLNVIKCTDPSCSATPQISVVNGISSAFNSIAIGTDGYPFLSYRGAASAYLNITKCSNSSCAPAASSTANLASNASSYSNFFDDVGYNNVATDDTVYDTITGATSTKLAFNFKKAASANTADISVTWNGQISIATSTSLQVYNNTTSAWDTIQTNASPTPNSDFTLTGTVSGTQYYDGSNIATMRLVTGTTTKYTTLKTDQIDIQFVTPTLTQRDYVFLNDDGGDVNSYTRAHSAATSTQISNVKKGERLITRIQVDNTGAGTSTSQYRLQWSSSTDNSTYGNWNDLGTTTEIKWSLSSKGALWGRPDGVPLTSRQVSATTTCSDSNYQAGRFVAGTATSTAFSIGGGKCTELAYALETSGATLGKYYRLRLVSASTTTAFDNYIYYPTFQIESTRTLTYSKEARGSYATSTPYSTGYTGVWSSVAIGTDGLPVIAFTNYGDSLYLMKCNDPSCSSNTVNLLDGTLGEPNYIGYLDPQISMALGVDGFPVISYFAGASTAGTSLKLAKCGDSSCSVALVATSTLDSSNGAGITSSLAIGSDGYPIISYYATTTANLMLAKCANLSCSSVSTTTLESAGDVGMFSSIAIGSDGYPVIAYQDNTVSILKVDKCSDVSCSGTPATSSVDDGTYSGAMYVSMAIGSDGFPVISEYDWNYSDLKVAKCNNATCSSAVFRILDTDGNTGLTTSLAIGTDGFPVMSYYDSSSDDLRFAKCGDVSCSVALAATSTLDATGNVGVYTSLAIGSDGFPVMSSCDVTNGNLNFAKCSNASCAPTSSSAANLTSGSGSYDTFLDDYGYNAVAFSDDVYDSIAGGANSRLAFNFKKATSSNTDQINVTWNGQISISTTTSLQVYNNTTSLWETLQTNITPQINTDFTLTGSVYGTRYFDTDNVATARVVTGTTTNYTTLKTDQINIQFASAPTLTMTVSTDNFGTLTPGTYKIATSTITVTTENPYGYTVSMYGNNQGSGAASTTMYLSPTVYATGIPDQTEWVPGAATTSVGNAVTRASLISSGDVLAFRVMSASGSFPFLSPTWWGNTDIDGTAKWAGIASSTVARVIGNSSSAASIGAINTIQYYLDVASTQQSGVYTGDITYTAVMTP